MIKYTGASGGSITGITRGNNKKSYIKGTPVRKYELGGVSLARINKTHLLSNVTDLDPNPITFDSYTIKIEPGGDISGNNELNSINRVSDGSAASFLNYTLMILNLLVDIMLMQHKIFLSRLFHQILRT